MCTRHGTKNLNEAYKKVKANKGASEVDGIEVEELIFQKTMERNPKIISLIRKQRFGPGSVPDFLSGAGRYRPGQS